MNDSSELKGSLVERVTAAVRDHIRDNGLRPGDALPSEGRLAADLGISRAVVREAFGALAALRQIDVGNGRRARVAALDGSVLASLLDHAVATAQVSAAQVWEVRRMVERETAALAARNRSDAQARDIAAAAGVTRDMSESAAFSQAVARASGNPLLDQIGRSLCQFTDAAGSRSENAETLDLCEAISQAIADCDPSAATALVDRRFDLLTVDTA